MHDFTVGSSLEVGEAFGPSSSRQISPRHPMMRCRITYCFALSPTSISCCIPMVMLHLFDQFLDAIARPLHLCLIAARDAISPLKILAPRASGACFYLRPIRLITLAGAADGRLRSGCAAILFYFGVLASRRAVEEDAMPSCRKIPRTVAISNAALFCFLRLRRDSSIYQFDEASLRVLFFCR